MDPKSFVLEWKKYNIASGCVIDRDALKGILGLVC